MGIGAAVRRMLRPDHRIGVYWEQYLDTKRGKRSRAYVQLLDGLYHNHVEPTFGALAPEDVTMFGVEQWHASLAHVPVSANRAAHRVLRALYNWMGRRGIYGGRNPVEGLESYTERVRRRTATPDELSLLHRRLDSVVDGSEAIAASCVRLIVYTGLRRNEALYLRWSAVRDGRLELLDTKTGYVCRWLCPQAEALLESIRRTDQRVFPICLSALKDAWNNFRSDIGARDLNLHDLRRTWSSRLADAGVPAEDVAALAGQTRMTNLRHYRHLSTERLQEIAARGGELMSEGETKWASAGTSR